MTELVFEKVRLTTFTLDVPGLPHIVWDVGLMENDAFHGRFGAPEEGSFEQLAKWSNPEDYWRHVDKTKVLKFIRLAHVKVIKPEWQSQGVRKTTYCLLDIPTITAIIHVPGKPDHAFPVDGNHRMLARMQLKKPTYPRFVVPPELEGEYRIDVYHG